MRKLVKVPDGKLRKKSKPVKKIDKGITQLAGEMVKFLLAPHGDSTPVGLSAVQLGELVRMVVFKRNPDSTEQKDIQVIINPEVTRERGYHLVREGCLSIPGKVFLLQRAKVVKIRGLDLTGTQRTFRGQGLLAQVFQHEMNHLDGVLIDTLGEEIKNS
jgi:peptide deformylase